MSYKHITSFQRNELSALLRAGIKKKDIAKLLNKDRISIWRELKKNDYDNRIGYDARKAKNKTKQRRIEANQRFRKIENNKWLRNYIIRNGLLKKKRQTITYDNGTTFSEHQDTEIQTGIKIYFAYPYHS